MFTDRTRQGTRSHEINDANFIIFRLSLTLLIIPLVLSLSDCQKMLEHVMCYYSFAIYYYLRCWKRFIINVWITCVFCGFFYVYLLLSHSVASSAHSTPLHACISMPSYPNDELFRFCQHCGYIRQRLHKQIPVLVSVKFPVIDSRIQTLHNQHQCSAYCQQKTNYVP